MSNSPLQLLRAQLADLRGARGRVRWFSAFSALGTAALWLLAGLFALDFIFQREMQTPQRLVLIVLAAGMLLWAFRKYAWPLLVVRESEIDIALLVERHHQIDSDLVAALQFERDEQGRLGSRQLETAVVDYVAHTGFDVFAGLDRAPFHRRATLCGLTIACVAVAALMYPAHFKAFITRLTLGHAHYPSATLIQGMAVNGRSIHLAGLQPANVRLAEGRPIDFLIACEGVLPAQGKAKVSSSLRSEHTDLVLEPLSLDDRLVRLKNALQMAEEAQSSTEVDVAGQWYDDLAANLQLEAPEIWETLRQEVGAAAAGRRAKMIQKHLPKMQEQVSKLIADWPRHANQRQLFTASLPRLMEPVYYRLTLGDAYTDPAEIAMIPLPVVEAKVTPKPPAYAERVLALSTVGRQSAVLVGSEVKVELACTNHKPLKEAWITVRDADQLQRFDLKAMSEDRFSFQLATPNTPFHRIERELRYEIQVTDTDGLHLESPVQGIVRLRIDKPPVALVSTIHRVAIPTAKPRIQYRVGDDFGLKRLSFEVVVKRLAAESPVNTGTGDKPPAEKPLERTVFDMLAGKRPLTPEELPYVGKSSLDLSQLKLDPAHARLDKGDRLEVVLVAEDDRGDLPGEIFRTEPLVIEITDQAGLMDAVSEINPRAEQQFNEIIQREIGIGESP